MCSNARLAQLVEHLIDVERVRGSSPLPRTEANDSERRVRGKGLERRSPVALATASRGREKFPSGNLLVTKP